MAVWYKNGPHDYRYGVFENVTRRVFVVDFFKAHIEETKFKLIVNEVMEYHDLDTAIMATIMGYDMSLMPSDLSAAISRCRVWLDEYDDYDKLQTPTTLTYTKDN